MLSSHINPAKRGEGRREGNSLMKWVLLRTSAFKACSAGIQGGFSMKGYVKEWTYLFWYLLVEPTATRCYQGQQLPLSRDIEYWIKVTLIGRDTTGNVLFPEMSDVLRKRIVNVMYQAMKIAAQTSMLSKSNYDIGKLKKKIWWQVPPESFRMLTLKFIFIYNDKGYAGSPSSSEFFLPVQPFCCPYRWSYETLQPSAALADHVVIFLPAVDIVLPEDMYNKIQLK